MSQPETTAVVPIEPTKAMLRAYHCAMARLIRDTEPAERERRWGKPVSRRGKKVYVISDDEKAVARWQAMVRAASLGDHHAPE